MSLFPQNKGNVDYEDELTPLFPKQGSGGTGTGPGFAVETAAAHDDGGDGGGGRRDSVIGGGLRMSVMFDKSIINYKTLTSNERELLVMGRPNVTIKKSEHEMKDLIVDLFLHDHHHSHAHPRSNPQLPPFKRFSRHRNFYVYELNQFRHWWKTSRLLLRLSGGIIYSKDPLNWATMALWRVGHSPKQAKHALKQMKSIGKGGVSRLFLQLVHPFTRTIRIILAVCRAWEARVDNRLYEVGLAEAFAFMGNRCSRYWTRKFTDWFTATVMFPLSAVLLEPYLPQDSRPIIMLMGFLRAVLPFAASFQGSRFGRQVTFNTYKYANYWWKSVQGIMHFHEHTGVYQHINLDPDLLALARLVAESVGHGADPEDTRRELTAIGFRLYGCGAGGYSVYQMKQGGKIVLLHLTPYGPSILDEMPRFVLLERRNQFYVNRLSSKSDGIILDAATPREAKVRGFTYSGAFFQMQEWAALKTRHEQELADYSNACSRLGTKALPPGKRSSMQTKMPAPPKDLASLKAFIRGGRLTYKQRRDNDRWEEIQVQVKKMAKLIGKYQKDGKAPSRVILYLEGLDCAGKSSTGMLICQALEECGYSVDVAQHNRPPTPEQRAKPWMDRIRFEYPEDMYDDPKDVPDYACLLWDRGPGGDFVYGSLGELSPEDKLKKYNEFRKYDYTCRQDGVLFFKCFFVSGRDTIASTLGKRLAHKQIVRDLRTWLDANSVAQAREGLEEIELHLDPTDFVAFNKYEENLSKFSEFARNTDYVGRMGDDKAPIYHNPWLVINTSNRHSARLNMLRAFSLQLFRFATTPFEEQTGILAKLKSMCTRDRVEEDTTHAVPSDIVEVREHGLSFRAVFQSFVLFLLFYAYAYQTWNFDIEDIT